MAGDFTSYNGTGRIRIARLNADGNVDTGFDPGTGANDLVASLTLQPDGKVLIGGHFADYSGATRKGYTRLNTDGSLDIGFNPGTGANGVLWSIALQPDGKVLLGGDLTSCNGAVRNRIARTNADGSVDTGFDPAAGVTGGDQRVYSVVARSNGKILIGGYFYSYNGVQRSMIAQLNTDGSLDNGFDAAWGANGTVYSIAMQPDGKVLIGGAFTTYHDVARSGIARLNVDGSLDTSFDPGTGAGASVLSVIVQPDGKILIAGSFGSYNGTSRHDIARLNTDGSLDASFDPGSGADGWIWCMARQPDGKILVGGGFITFADTPLNNLARLNADGTLDTSFDPGSGPNGSLSAGSIAVQSDSKILIGGGFSSYNGTARNRIARLNTDGSLDIDFNPGTGSNGGVLSIALQPDGKILIGGGFSAYNGTGRNHIARVEGGSLPAVSIKALLDGPYSSTTGLMGDALRVAGLVPLSEPYTALGYSFNGGGGESTTAPVLAVTGNNAIVDWVVIELRSNTAPATVLASRSALLQRDGDVVGMDGI
ncbi:MAG TPA: delta-60 repeat domain-containing protein, partial [Flavobacteriales bacterium]|nr:delta-60 repeat domain-containing protein [Flavobacteriales bacterium]